MLEHVDTMYDNISNMLRKLKKGSYENNMKIFREKNQKYIQEMIDFMEASDNKDKAAKEIAAMLANAVEKRFVGTNGKIKSRQQADINFFMIYYTFPAILLSESEYAHQINQSICDEWAVRFKDSNIGYTDYDSIYSKFNEKILGIF